MSLDIELRLSPSLDADFEKYATTQLKNRLHLRSQAISQKIRDPLKEVVRKSIMATPEYRSLLGGKLQGELGVTFPQERLSAIIETWVNGIHVKTQASRKPLLRIDIGFLAQGYGDVLSLAEASYEYQRGQIPWLEWLLQLCYSRL